MAKAFLSIPIINDPDEMRQAIYTAIKTHFPDWEPEEAALDTWIIDGTAFMAADLGDLAADVPVEIFRQFGISVMQIPSNDPVPATAKTKWVLKDNLGYTIPAGTQVNIAVSGSEQVAFVTTIDVVVAPGKTTAEAVVIEAVEPGTSANGLAEDPTLVDSLDFVTSIELEAPTSGGVDEEDPTVYLERLTKDLRLLTPRPITVDNVAQLAQNIDGIYRALAIDLYNAETEAEGEEKTVTVAVVDEQGQPVSAGIKAELKKSLEELREVNFVFFVIDPTYDEIDVTVTLTAKANFNVETVKAAVKEALEALFDPATSGRKSNDPRDWQPVSHVYLHEVVSAIEAVEGVDFIKLLGCSIAIHGNELKVADITLVGKAVLTKPGTFTITVEAP